MSQSLPLFPPAFDEALRRHKAGDLAGARQIYLDLVDQPELTGACLHQLALIAALRGEHRRAAALFRQVVRLDPGHWTAYPNLSAALDRLGDVRGAVATLVDFGALLQTNGRGQDAEQIYRQVLNRDPLNYGAWVNLGNCLAWQGRPLEGAPCLLQALRLYGRLLPAIARFSALLEERLLASSGYAAVVPVLSLPPGLPNGAIEKIEDALTTLGKILSDIGSSAEAIDCHRQSVQMAPGYALGHWNLALALLSAGDWRGGWAEYEWRWHWAAFPEQKRTLRAPHWRGEDLTGKRILVWAEQGYGDAIQFAPLAHSLRDLGAEVFLEVQAPLLRLFNNSLKDVTVLPRLDDPDGILAGPSVDYEIALMSLPERLALDSDCLPLDTGYLRPSEEGAAQWQSRLDQNNPLDQGRKLRVGLVWAGRPTHSEDRRRSLPLAALRALCALPDVQYYSLQVGARQQDLSDPALAHVIDLAPDLQDFSDTAAAIAQLDLVISVDTAVAHLAAAMGRPTWLLLSRFPEWRWQTSQGNNQKGDTAWYPSLRIFQQADAGDWAGAITQVHTALKQNSPESE